MLGILDWSLDPLCMWQHQRFTHLADLQAVTLHQMFNVALTRRSLSHVVGEMTTV